MLAASAIAVLAGIPRRLWALQENETVIDFADLQGFRTDLRDAGPRIRCFDLRQLNSFITPEEQFYTFHQTQAVQVNAANWKLRLGGFVDPPREFTLNDLKRQPDKKDKPQPLTC